MRVYSFVDQVTTITFFRYKSFGHKVWAFGMMQFAHRYLKNVPGLEFYKLLGTGKGSGFNPWPDFSTYALLQVWSDRSSAKEFFSDSLLSKKYDMHAAERWTVYLHAVKAEGKWSRANPFEINESASHTDHPIAVITRASIRKRRLLRFWRYVPTSQRPLKNIEGLIYTKGIGEVPFLQMATFSIWKDAEAMKKFAYQSAEHAKAIKLTRELNWYSEELFSRFRPFDSEGTWGGENPLKILKGL